MQDALRKMKMEKAVGHDEKHAVPVLLFISAVSLMSSQPLVVA